MYKKTIFTLILYTLLYGVSASEQNIQQITRGLERSESLRAPLRAIAQQNWEQALSMLQEIIDSARSNELKAEAHYLQGVVYNRQDNYQSAREALEKSLTLRSDNPNLFYEYGQTLYALNEFSRSQQFFRRSMQQDFMKPQSLYYLAHISQLLDQHLQAIEFFNLLIAESTTPRSLRQIAHFQRADSMMRIARNQSDNLDQIVKNDILPNLYRALEINPQSAVASDIQQRIIELQREFETDPNVLVSGRRISAKRWQLQLAQRMSYDNNITFANDLPTTQATQEDAFIFQSILQAQYTHVLRQRFLVTPFIRMSHLTHSKRNDPEIHKNDSYSIRPSLRTQTEFTLFERPATFLLDFDYDYIARDYSETKTKQFYARSTSYSLGQRLQLFRFGESTLRFRSSDYQGHEQQMDRTNNSYSFDQVVVLPNRHMIILLFLYDQLKAENTINSSDSMTYRIDYLVPELTPEITLGLNLTYSSVDLYNDPQRSGADTILSPGISFTKRLGQRFRARLSYNYTDFSSSISENEYDKHNISAELRVSF